MRITILALLASGHVLGANSPVPDSSPAGVRARELKEIIQKEKPAFHRRETEKKNLIEALDKLNADQNGIRRRIADIHAHQQEVDMALANLALEFKKQKELESAEKQRMLSLFKVVYRIKRDGVLRFLVHDDSMSRLAGRFRVLYRTLRAHSMVTRQLQERATRLTESEKKLGESQSNMHEILVELSEQEGLLKELLQKKNTMLAELNSQQSRYHGILAEYKKVSQELRALFENFESERMVTAEADPRFPMRGTIALPLTEGHIVKRFGRLVSEKFGTVVYQKGMEIEAPHNTPVKAVLPGEVEFEGWVRGLGNVVIVHHGGGFYSLSAHLFKTMKPKGAKVEQGDVIGTVGDTGNDGKPSLYFELRENSKAVDPSTYIASAELKKLSSPIRVQ